MVSKNLIKSAKYGYIGKLMMNLTGMKYDEME